MVEKLKSITRPIPWSLVLKAGVAGVLWLFASHLLLPFWVFALVVFYFYISSLMQIIKLAVPLALVIFFAAALPAGFLPAIYVAVCIYVILGIKNFVFIDRKSAYEILFLLLMLSLSVWFFFASEARQGPPSIFFMAVFGAILFLLSREFPGYSGGIFTGDARRRWDISMLIASFILCEFLFVTHALPLNAAYQSAIFFLTAAIMFETIFDYLLQVLTRRQLLLNFSAFFIFITIILGAAPWGL